MRKALLTLTAVASIVTATISMPTKAQAYCHGCWVGGAVAAGLVGGAILANRAYAYGYYGYPRYYGYYEPTYYAPYYYSYPRTYRYSYAPAYYYGSYYPRYRYRYAYRTGYYNRPYYGYRRAYW